MQVRSPEKFTILDALRYKKRPKFEEYMPKATYILGTLELDASLVVQVFGKHFSTSFAGHNIVPIGWNAIDAFCSVSTAVKLLSDPDYYCPQKNAITFLNLASGLNLFSLTDSFHSGAFFGVAKLGVANTLASPAFAFAMFCDFLIAGIQCYYSTRKGYLEAMIGEMDFLADRISHYHKEIEKNIKAGADEQILESLRVKLKPLLLRQVEVTANVRAQIFHYETTPTYNRDPTFKAFITKQKNKIDTILEKDSYCTGPTYTRPINMDFAQIEKERLKLHKANTCNLAIKAASFGGMFLQALPTIMFLASATLPIPYFNIISLCIISTVALIYLYQLATMPEQSKEITEKAITATTKHDPGEYLIADSTSPSHASPYSNEPYDNIGHYTPSSSCCCL